MTPPEAAFSDPLELVSHGSPGSGPHLMLSALASALVEARVTELPPITVATELDGAAAIRRVAAGGPGVLGSCTPTYLTTPVVHGLAETWRSLTPVAGLVADSYLLVASAGTYASPAELFARAGTVAVPKRGGNTDIQAMLIAEATGTEIEVLVEHDPARLIDLLQEDRAQWTTGVYSDFSVELAAGRLAVLATFDPEPTGGTTATLREHGIDVAFPLWRGVIGAGGLSAADTAWWDESLRAALAQPAWGRYISAERQRTAYLPAAKFTALLAAEDKRYVRWLSVLDQ